MAYTQSENSPTAAFLSFLIPGWGQYHKGKKLQGLLWLIVVLAGYIAMVIPGFVLHLFCIGHAYLVKN